MTMILMKSFIIQAHPLLRHPGLDLERHHLETQTISAGLLSIACRLILLRIYLKRLTSVYLHTSLPRKL
jgi:hypothetical protein